MDTPNENHSFGQFLKFWRNIRKLSQEELAFRHDSSPRHISRLENGSSRPSEKFIEEISEVLELGERDRNHLRISAGYSAKQKKVYFHDPEMKWLRKAMRLTLQSLDPYPTTLTDSIGNILMVNKGWVSFYQKILPHIDLKSVTNVYDFMFSREGFGPYISDRDNAHALILMALQQEIMLNDNDEQKNLLERLLKYPNTPDDWQERAAKYEPMASFRLQIDYEGSLKQFYSVSQTVGAAGPTAYFSEPKLTISTLYPEDETINLTTTNDDKLKHPLLIY